VQAESEPREPSWSRLVDPVRAGDPAGMEQLYAVFVKGVRFFLWRQLGPQDLDDKVHDVFLIITQSIQKGELREPDRLMGYVRTVVRRQVAAHLDNAVHARRNQSIDPAMTLSDPTTSQTRGTQGDRAGEPGCRLALVERAAQA
jgi:RNA polymerase sigma-70 factor (ECF subfamily)